MLMIPLILWVDYDLQVCPATSAIYPDFMLLTSYLWKFILVCRSLDYKLLNGSAPRSTGSQESSPISRISSNLSDSDHTLHGRLRGGSNLLPLMAWTPNLPCSKHPFQRTILPVCCSSCLYILTVLYLVTYIERAASSSHAPEYPRLGLIPCLHPMAPHRVHRAFFTITSLLCLPLCSE